MVAMVKVEFARALQAYENNRYALALALHVHPSNLTRWETAGHVPNHHGILLATFLKPELFHDVRESIANVAKARNVKAAQWLVTRDVSLLTWGQDELFP